MQKILLKLNLNYAEKLTYRALSKKSDLSISIFEKALINL